MLPSGRSALWEAGKSLAFMISCGLKWQIPDRIVFVEAIPRTGVGKFLKRELRDRYRDSLT